MKRISLLVVLFMFVIGASCFAEETQTQQSDARLKDIYKQASSIVDLYGDCVYLYKTSGLSYKQFDEMFTNATLQKNRFISKNKDMPKELLDAMNDIDTTFADTRDLWKESIYSSSIGISKNGYYEYLLKRYPLIKSVKRQGLFGLYNTQELLNILAQYCITKNDELQQMIQRQNDMR